jgi:hypothetical protein
VQDQAAGSSTGSSAESPSGAGSSSVRESYSPLPFFQLDFVATERTATGVPFFVDFSCTSLPTKPMREMRRGPKRLSEPRLSGVHPEEGAVVRR